MNRRWKDSIKSRNQLINSEQGRSDSHPIDFTFTSSESRSSSAPVTPLYNFDSAYTAPRKAPSPRPPVFPPASSSSIRSFSSSIFSSSRSPPPPPQPVPHPFTMHAAPLPVVSSRDDVEEEEDCPVCLEPLSFSFRLPGEKPHIVPECGHSLHEACFTAVYGPPPNAANRNNVPRKSNLGVCGVCRRPMKVGDGDSGKSNKLAALTGMGERNAQALYPGRGDGNSQIPFSPTTTYGSTSNVNTGYSSPNPNGTYSRNRAGTNASRLYDPSEDDPAEGHHKSHHDGQGQYIVSPAITIRPEFSSLTRTEDQTQPLTCIVVIELPGKRATGAVPGAVPAAQVDYSRSDFNPSRSGTNSTHSASPRPDHPNNIQGSVRGRRDPYEQSPAMGDSDLHPPHYAASSNGDHSSHHGHSKSVTDSLSPSVYQQINAPQSSAFSAITTDLRSRIVDWKGHPLSDLGPLQMYDLLSVRREQLVREFYVYLFREALICVVEEKKRSLGRLLSNASSGFAGDFNHNSAMGSRETQKGVLRLKGRIYVRHIKQVTASSAAGEMSLTIDMEDELASFILIYRERETMEAWKARIEALVSMFHQSPQVNPPDYDGPLDMEEFGGSSKAMRMLSGATTNTTRTGNTVSSSGTATTNQDSLLGGLSSRSSSTSHGSYHQQYSSGGYATGPKLSNIGEEDDLSTYSQRTPQSSGLVQPHMSSGPSNSLPPLPHPPMDIIVVLSVPPPSASPSTAQLKIRVIRATLDFLIGSMGKGDRMSIVTFEVGPSGKVRKTPFLSCNPSVNGGKSRERLLKFVDGVGMRNLDVEAEDEFLVRGSKDEKTDVVTAVNHGLDVVLQRKTKNPVSSMLLVSDASDSTRRAQMDLVLARAEAANVPIHSFGYGRSHDPASLWLMSNHTSGTYTFVKDWYDLRECIAGCVGGMMSIGLLNMKLHMKVVDGTRFRIRKVSGGPSSILASDGQNVDVDVGELRYGERKEMLIELELDNTDMQAKLAIQRRMGQGQHGSRSLNATDQFVQSMGLDALAIDDAPDFTDGMMERMIDEVPVVEVDGSFFDPAAAKHVSRLAHPVLLTVTLLPPSPGQSQRQPNNSISDPVIVRRRMELLTSDMITRALVLVSRRNYAQAQKILSETKRILHTVLQTISRALPPPNSNGSTVRNRKEILTLGGVRAMQSMLQDLQILSDALDENVDLFAHDQRNFGAQQAMILRDQKSWSGRSATERLFWTTDNSIELVSRSTDWVTQD